MQNTAYEIKEPKRSWLRIIMLLVALVVVAVLIALAYYFTKINRGASSQSVPVAITIKAGENSREIANDLYANKVIRNPNIFWVYTKLNGAAGKIQAGTYTLDKKMSIVEIVDILTAGKVTRDDKKVTLIEGWTNKQISAYLQQRGIADAAEFNTALAKDYNFKFKDTAKVFNYEGFLFPDTYQIPKDAEASVLVNLAVKNFEKKFTDQMLSDMQKSGRTLSETVIMASIIEKEVGRNTTGLSDADVQQLDQERKLVASVFYNRLKIDMALQSDATINYVTGKTTPSVSAADLELDSKYNTYKYKGLPPGPIGNPGLDSLKAALYPAESNYLYFLSKPDGTAVFAKTLEEHNANKAKYLK